MLLWPEKLERPEIPKNLPELGSLVGTKADTCPVLHNQSTINFVLAIARLLVSMGKIHKTLVQKVSNIQHILK